MSKFLVISSSNNFPYRFFSPKILQQSLKYVCPSVSALSRAKKVYCKEIGLLLHLAGYRKCALPNYIYEFYLFFSYALSLVISTNHEGFVVRRQLTNVFFHVAKSLPPGLFVR